MFVGLIKVTVTVPICIFLHISLVFCQEIIEPPNDATVFVNQFAEFLCEVDGGLADWSLNGIFFGSLSSEIHDDLATYRSVSENGYTLLRLVIRAKAKHNGTLVQCVTGDFNGITDKSINVTLEIQGFLHPVVDLTTTLNTTSIIVSWTAPFSLDVTGVDPDVWYTIFIYNVTHDPITISCTDCVNITETHYTFYPDYYNPCHKYNFTVIPFNGAGQGQSNGNITSKCEAIIHVDYEQKGVNIRCVFKQAQSAKCYVQLISDVLGGYHEGKCLEEEGHNFVNLVAGIYTLLVYTQEDRQYLVCSPTFKYDYITVFTVTKSQITQITPTATITYGYTETVPESHLRTICVEGIGIGICLGTVAVCIVFIVTTIILRTRKHLISRNKEGTTFASVNTLVVEKNAAYEIHKPNVMETTHIPIYEEV